MSLPPVVVSTAYKQGYEEANIRWKVVKMVQNGIPVPSKLKNNDVYKSLIAQEKETPLEAIVSQPKPEKGEAKPEAETLDPMARPNPLPKQKAMQKLCLAKMPKLSQKQILISSAEKRLLLILNR
jgi:hypothetical protein